MVARTRVVIVIAAVVGLGLLAGGAVCRRSRGQEIGQAGHSGDEYFCPMHPQIVRDKPGECPVCGMKLEKRQSGSPSAARHVLYYRHPMDPAVRSDHPAKDDMGMDYVPVYAEEAHADEAAVPGRATVAVPPERAQLLGIRSEPVGSGSTGGSVRTVGRVVPDERRREVVHAKYDGYVEKLYADFTGQPVRRGQPLLAIYSPELVAAQEEYLVARRAQARLDESRVPGVAQGSRELAEAARQRLAAYDVSPAEVEAMERAGKAQRTITLRAPVSGIVVQKTAFQGMKLSPADRLYEIADLSRVWVLADVYEQDRAAARIGARARLTLADQPSSEWRGVVTFVSPVVKPDTRTFEARIELDNPGGLLKPDMFTDVYLEAGGAAALTVPETAVIRTGERTLVFVDQGQGRYEPREVVLGARTAGGYQVRRGVAAGERVVVSANFLLDSESSLRAAIAAAGR